VEEYTAPTPKNSDRLNKIEKDYPGIGADSVRRLHVDITETVAQVKRGRMRID
jgi:hypothetical protein